MEGDGAPKGPAPDAAATSELLKCGSTVLMEICNVVVHSGYIGILQQKMETPISG